MAGRRKDRHLRIGTSGFSYKHWREVFYPADVPQRKWLEHYAGHFDTVELNSTFYHLPKAETFDSWRERVPQDFLFVLKLSRLITHQKRLKDAEEPLEVFLERAARLGDRLGPILVQLPPGLAVDVARLDGFLKRCPRGHRWAVEFRNATWLCDEVCEALRVHGAALCIHDLIRNHREDVTADFVYLRFHGSGRKYAGSYPDEALASAAERARGWLGKGIDVFAYFNNDQRGYAVANARELKRRVLETG